MCDVFLVLAQAPGGLSCFLLPRVLPDGSRNAMHLMRLKDKLGNRSNASAEVEYHGATAWLVGEEGRGARTILEMVNLTRLDCVIGSAAGMRYGVTRAVHHTRHRGAFGRKLIDQPLMRNVLADLALESEAATALMTRLAGATDRAIAGDQAESALRRTALAVGKYWVCKRAPVHASEALECLGGNGYVEESQMPRLFRESPLNSIWEGSGNVAALDVLRALGREPEAQETFFAKVSLAAGADQRLDDAADRLRKSLGDVTDIEVRARAHRRGHGPGPAGFPARTVRAPGRRRRLLRLPPDRRVGPRLRYPASGPGPGRPHRPRHDRPRPGASTALPTSPRGLHDIRRCRGTSMIPESSGELHRSPVAPSSFGGFGRWPSELQWFQ